MEKLTPVKQQIRRRRGSTLVEFALIVPVLLAKLMGIIEFGWLVKNNLTIANPRARALAPPLWVKARPRSTPEFKT